LNALASEIARLSSEVASLLASPEHARSREMPGGCYFLDRGEIVALPRDGGDSRYPYGRDGFNFWAYTSGYMHANEGLFSVFLRSAEGQEPKVAFFAGFPDGKGGYAPISLMPVPVLSEGDGRPVRRFSVLTPSAAYYLTELQDILAGVRVFVGADKSIAFSVCVINRSARPQTLYLSSFINPYLRHQIYESGEDRWFKEVRVVPPAAPGGLGSFLILVNEDKDRHHSITNYGVIRRACEASGGSLKSHEETASRYQFVGGARRSLEGAASLRRGSLAGGQAICTFVETAVAADMLHVEVMPSGSIRADALLERPANAAAADRLIGQMLKGEDLDRRLVELVAEEVRGHAGLRVQVGPSSVPELQAEVFNAFFEHLKKQVEFCSLIKGYVQLSENSLIGVRDVFQALEGFLFWQPAAARQKMLEALGYTAPDGRCFRQYSLPSASGEIGRMDLRPFIDQGCWVISAMATYLRVTGDRAFLDQECGYHEIVDEASRKVQRSAVADSVLSHLLRIMDFLLGNRDSETGCVRALYGDWNDALDGLGVSMDPSKAYGTGVSVMATLQVYQNTREMIEMLEWLDAKRHAARIAEYRQAADDIALGLKRFAVVADKEGGRRILHGWGDRRSYSVGGFHDPDGVARDGLTSNAFWVLSGLHEEDPGMGQAILEAFQRLDSKYAFKTFEPFFPPDTPGVGRIGKLPPGTAENGATYVHATVFAIMALFRMGRAREGWAQLVKVLPFTALHGRLTHSPFVMPNAYGFNPGKNIDGENMNDWQTGSSNVLLKLLIRYVFGLEPQLDGVWIQPAAWLPFKTSEFETQLRGGRLVLKFDDQGRASRTFRVNGTMMKSERDPVLGIEKLWLPYERLRGGRVEVLIEQ